ncbi:mitochondrial ribosomal protein L28-domain-containing protein, partial [Thamnocephalis sphaerospora]
ADASLGGDPRNQMLKRILFDTPPRTPTVSEEQKAQDQVIERAWALERQRTIDAHHQELARQWAKMEEAHDELLKADARLYRVANNYEHGMAFPRQMRAPTHTPPVGGWNYDFKA